MTAAQEERAMQINPGGRLNTNDVVGRDNEIGKYWRVLERQGLRPPALEDVSSAVDTPVYDPHDPAKLNYYVTRLSSYYADDERSLALVVLDTMAGPSVADTRPGTPQSVQAP